MQVRSRYDHIVRVSARSSPSNGVAECQNPIAGRAGRYRGADDDHISGHIGPHQKGKIDVYRPRENADVQ